MLRFGDCNGITTTNTVPNRHNFFTAKLFLFSFFKTVIFNGRYFFEFICGTRSSADRNNKKGKDFDLKMAKKTQKNHKFAYETFALIFIFSPISPVCATPLRYASFVRHYLHFFFWLPPFFFISVVVYLILCFVCYLLVYIRPTKYRWSRAPLLKSEIRFAFELFQGKKWVDIKIFSEKSTNNNNNSRNILMN